MKSRAELLAEIEEKRLDSNSLRLNINELSITESGLDGGYNPYDNPGISKELPDDADITLRRRRIMLRKR